MLKNYNHCISCGLKEDFQTLKQNFKNFSNIILDTIPREDNIIVYALAKHGRLYLGLSLFF